MLASAALAAAGPKYRVRSLGGSTRGDGWIDPDVERTEALKRELRDTKKRMKKHAQMKDWLLKKNDREADLMRQDQQHRELERAQAQERDTKFKRHADQQKRELEHYYAKLHQEASSVFSPETDDDDDRGFLGSREPPATKANLLLPPGKKKETPHHDDTLAAPINLKRRPDKGLEHEAPEALSARLIQPTKETTVADPPPSPQQPKERDIQFF